MIRLNMVIPYNFFHDLFALQTGLFFNCSNNLIQNKIFLNIIFIINPMQFVSSPQYVTVIYILKKLGISDVNFQKEGFKVRVLAKFGRKISDFLYLNLHDLIYCESQSNSLTLISIDVKQVKQSKFEKYHKLKVCMHIIKRNLLQFSVYKFSKNA